MRNRKKLPLDVLAPYLLEPPDRPGPIDWAALFGNLNPVELEVGFGKGGFLVTAAEAEGEVNFVGIEVDRGLQLYVATRLAKRRLGNVRLVKADAWQFLRDCVADRSLAAVHVYFPDPWWKKRHKKRRVFTADFARQCERVLVPGGRLSLATDVREYFEVMTGHVADHTGLREVARSEIRPDAVTRSARTNFERKAREQNRSVWQALYEKPSRAA